MNNPKITVYSADWCAACAVAKGKLKAAGLEYTDVDIDKDRVALVYAKSLHGTIPLVEVRNSTGDIIMFGGSETVDKLLEYMGGADEQT